MISFNNKREEIWKRKAFIFSVNQNFYLPKYFEKRLLTQLMNPRIIDKHENPKARPRFPPAAARNAPMS